VKSDALDHRRLFERSRYEALLTDRIRIKPWKFYGMHNHGKDAWPQLDKFSITSLIDVGTGRGAFPVMAAERGIKHVAGVDFAFLPKAEGVRWVQAPAHELPFASGEFEWLTAFDMLEHVLPEELDEVLKEFRRVASIGWFFSIAYEPSHVVMGSNLHLIVKPKAWWKEKLSAYGEVMEFTEQYLWLRFC